MVFQSTGQKPVQPKKDDACIIDIKKTKSGKRVTVRGKCNDKSVELAQKDMGLD